MTPDPNSDQLFKYAQDLQELMHEHGQLERRHQQVLQVLQEGKANSEKLLNLALHDPLTGLPNRRLLEQRLNEALISSSTNKTGLYLLYMDLDKFKPVNDQFGHAIGDEVLQEIAKRIQSRVRRGDTVARVGGDEFVVLLLNMASQSIAEAILASILRTVQKPIKTSAQTVCIGISMGCACYPFDGGDTMVLLSRADEAMYHAKRTASGYAFCNSNSESRIESGPAAGRE